MNLVKNLIRHTLPSETYAMLKTKRHLLHYGAVAFRNIPSRLGIAAGYYKKPFKEGIRWLFNSRETSNFSYDLDPLNESYLAALLSTISGVRFEHFMQYFLELKSNEDLKSHVKQLTALTPWRATSDMTARYCRRIGWYALTRAIKPKVVVETGIDKGLGSCVLALALMKNYEESGVKGRYFGTDINTGAGYLFKSPYSNFGRILYGDSIQSLNTFEEPIDLFINDSDHSAEYEAREYETIKGKLSQKAIILGDNAHCNDELLKFSLKTKRQFVFFQEKPAGHWYPGAGIGISFPHE
jgi:hypothetical protein